MSEKLDLREAEGEARGVLSRFPFPVLPIDPFIIAENVGIEVRAKESSKPGVSGFLVRVGDAFAIQYCKRLENEGFVRFTIAHELGHYFLPGHVKQLFPSCNGVHESRSGFVSDDRYERQADFFASALLMPEELFKSEIVRAGNGFSAIEELSRRFRTSLTATAIRYAKLSDLPVAIIVSSGRRIDYCFMSDRLRELEKITWIRKGDFLSKDTTTAKFNQIPSFVAQSKRSEGDSMLSDWFDGAPEVEVEEDVVGLGSYGKTLTVVFTDRDLEQEVEEDDE